METNCIRCGNSFDSDSWEIDVCENCELELSMLEKEDRLETQFDDSGEWDSDDDF